jgi:phospholipase D1/2
MICGWMISPEFQLKRPVDKYPDARFDAVLEKAAKNGVKIFILVYN